MTVTVTTYRMPDGFTGKIEKQARAIIKEVLEAAGASGAFLASAKTQLTMKANVKFRFIRYEKGQLVAKIKPGGNATAWEWTLTPPDGTDGAQLGRRLAGEPSDEELMAAAIPSNFDASKVSKAITKTAEPKPLTAKESAKIRSIPTQSERYEWQNPPEPAPAPPSETFTAATSGTIAERYALAEKNAQPYADRLVKVEGLRSQMQSHFDAAEKLESEIKREEVAAEKDASGKKAYETLHKIKQLLDM